MMINHDRITHGYQHCVDDIDLDWIAHATDLDITQCFDDLVNADIIPIALKGVANIELQRFWLIYWLVDEGVDYPYHIKDEASYSYYCEDPYAALADDSIEEQEDIPF